MGFGLVFGLVLVLARQACPPIASSSALVADDPRVCGRVHLGPAIGRSARHGGIGDGALSWFGPPTSTFNRRRRGTRAGSGAGQWKWLLWQDRHGKMDGKRLSGRRARN